VTTWLVRWDPAGDGPRLAVKDCIDVAGVVTTVASRAVVWDAGPAMVDAPCVADARKQGARIVGKTNLTELCRFAAGFNDYTGTPVNPLHPDLIPGGSSSGSAVAVAAGEADVAWGTDTGGSIRVPAACCGAAGLKTTRGRVSTAGVYPFSYTLDTVGPLAPDVAGLALGMRLLEPDFAPSGPVEGTVGRLRVPADDLVDRAVDAALAAAGLRTEPVPQPDWDSMVGVARLLMRAEGHRAQGHLLAREHLLNWQTARALHRGAHVSAEQEQAARDRAAPLVSALTALTGRYAALALPTMPTLPPRKDVAADVDTTYLTVPMNLAGLPAVAVPVPARPWPASLQLVGPPGGEERLLALAAQVEAAISR
jgi:amidase